MFYRFFKISNISNQERQYYNTITKNYINNAKNQNVFKSFLYYTNLENPYAQYTDAQFDINNLVAERIDVDFVPQIKKPKTNIFDKNNNKRLLEIFLSLDTNNNTSEAN